jgi:hypothetical protein
MVMTVPLASKTVIAALQVITRSRHRHRVETGELLCLYYYVDTLWNTFLSYSDS